MFKTSSSKISCRIAAFTLAACGLGVAVPLTLNQVERNHLNSQYTKLHQEFFTRSTPLFSQMDYQGYPKEAKKCETAIETARNAFIETTLAYDNYRIQRKKAAPNAMLEEHIDKVKLAVRHFEDDCRPFLGNDI